MAYQFHNAQLPPEAWPTRINSLSNRGDFILVSVERTNANLSAIIGNLYRVGIVHSSDGRFLANTPHTFPDLRSQRADCKHVEIKVALETNNPKGHLPKPGPHLIVRYVLCDENGIYKRGKENRGDVPWIWEIRVGTLKRKHFNVSNTAGDSGKTAVVSRDGMEALQVVYSDLERCPYARVRPTLKTSPRPPRGAYWKRGASGGASS